MLPLEVRATSGMAASLPPLKVQTEPTGWPAHPELKRHSNYISREQASDGGSDGCYVIRLPEKSICPCRPSFSLTIGRGEHDDRRASAVRKLSRMAH